MTLYNERVVRYILGDLEPRELRRLAELVDEEGQSRGFPFGWMEEPSYAFERLGSIRARDYGDSY